MCKNNAYVEEQRKIRRTLRMVGLGTIVLIVVVTILTPIGAWKAWRCQYHIISKSRAGPICASGFCFEQGVHPVRYSRYGIMPSTDSPTIKPVTLYYCDKHLKDAPESLSVGLGYQLRGVEFALWMILSWTLNVLFIVGFFVLFRAVAKGTRNPFGVSGVSHEELEELERLFNVTPKELSHEELERLFNVTSKVDRKLLLKWWISYFLVLLGLPWIGTFFLLLAIKAA